MRSMAPRETTRFFATAQFAESGVGSEHHHALPSSIAHAKQVGTILTECGLSALTWFKFWGLDFTDVAGDVCPDCAAAVRAKSRATTQPRLVRPRQ